MGVTASCTLFRKRKSGRIPSSLVLRTLSKSQVSPKDIEYVDASPPDVEIVGLEVVDIVIGNNPTPSSEVVIKSTSTFPNLFLEETNTFDNSIPESETFRFNLEEISSGSPTTHSELSLPDYKAFYVDNDHFKEKVSDLNHEEFADELAHIISPPEYDHFCFKIEPELGNLTMDVVNDIFPTREPEFFASTISSLPVGDEDIIFDPGHLKIIHSLMPDVSIGVDFSRIVKTLSIHQGLHLQLIWESRTVMTKKGRKTKPNDQKGLGMEKTVQTSKSSGKESQSSQKVKEKSGSKSSQPKV
ncbi:hypothetical protein Tco_1301145 [Tanacetum coccineum]